MNESFQKIKANDVKNNLINLSQLVFEVTDICNLKCKYCGYGELYQGYDPRVRGSLSFQKVRIVLDYLAKLWMENSRTSFTQPLTLSFYGGEPLINMDSIKNIINYAESLNITSKKIHYNMTTNGLLLDKHIDYLAEKKFNLLLSLDGDENGHSYRIDHQGKNSHKRVVENIKLLQKRHKEYFDRYVNFNTVLHSMNSAESALEYIKANFGKVPRFSPLNDSGIRKEKKQEFIKMFQNLDSSIEKSNNPNQLEAEMFLEAPNVVRLTNYFYAVSGNMVDNFNSLFIDRNNLKALPTGTCLPFYKKMFITVTGKILQCEKIHHEFALGLVSEDKVEIDFEQIANNANKYIFKFIKQCSSCALRNWCKECVYQNDEINSYKPQCNSYLSNASFQKGIQTSLDYLAKNPSLYSKIMKEVIIKN